MNKLTLVICILFYYTNYSHAAVWYVKTTPTGDNSGSSWANATSLSTTLNPDPTVGAVSGDEIWVKYGTYIGPLMLTTGIKLYGGFSGTELNASESDPTMFITIIDGSSSTRCLKILDTDSSTILRGFHLQNGSAPLFDMNKSDGDGGGALTVLNSNALIVSCSFTDNISDTGGGSIY